MSNIKNNTLMVALSMLALLQGSFMLAAKSDTQRASRSSSQSANSRSKQSSNKKKQAKKKQSKNKKYNSKSKQSKNKQSKSSKSKNASSASSTTRRRDKNGFWRTVDKDVKKDAARLDADIKRDF